MYVTVVGSGHGCAKKYVLIKESYRDENGKSKSRTVENLGSLETLLEKDPQALEKLKAQYAGERANKRGLPMSVLIVFKRSSKLRRILICQSRWFDMVISRCAAFGRRI